MPEKARGPWCRGGRGRGPEVGAGQALPLSKMMAATVPLQALYGEVWSTRRSKPALTTAAQRCSWVRMFSAQWGEGGGGDPVDCTPPFTPGLGTTGAHLPTLRGVTGGLLGVFGGSGTKTRGSVVMHTRACLPVLFPSGSQVSLVGMAGGIIFQQLQIAGLPLQHSLQPPGWTAVSTPSPAPCRRGPDAPMVSATTQPCTRSHLGHLSGLPGLPS